MIIVTGSKGFIGRNFLKAFEDTDDVMPMPDAARNIRKQASAENIRSLVQRPINK